jgi:hypothetical protein
MTVTVSLMPNDSFLPMEMRTVTCWMETHNSQRFQQITGWPAQTLSSKIKAFAEMQNSS